MTKKYRATKENRVRRADAIITKQAEALEQNAQLKGVLAYLGLYHLSMRAYRKAVRGRRGLILKLRKEFDTPKHVRMLEPSHVMRILING
jgi:hypothetical protein